ncbi:site-specific recombinase XerD [Mycobacterium sp. OAS707]|uniref:site-specific integrase n=1 Tax=Mycobacterium sp. OAS707 TaxID=2663822 RepID=UPI00178B52C8|nr:site-specific recombinase XerD [Mycobacterium sp. OAS707]
MTGEFYPDHLLPVISARRVDYGRFAEIRESVLLNHGYNTARAYWGDLDDVYWWAHAREKDVLDLSAKDVRQYVALLRRRKYSGSTIRRRVTALRKFYDELVARGMNESNPAAAVVIRRART